jgi:ElaB/YqjD/DUF883 family membrane-anchored ribosome-binding protein
VSTSDIQAKVAKTRAQLESTLDAIEDKLNVPKRVSEISKRAQEAIEKNPVPWIAGAVAAAVGVVALIAWALSSDD